MPREETAIITNMCMIYDQQGNILVEDRRKPDWPGIAFPGGHVERGESFVRSVIREVKEETGLDIEAPALCGLQQFTTREGARYVVLLYKTDRFSGTLRDSEEGRVFWIPRSELEKYPLAEGFLEVVRIFESDHLNEFYYYEEDGQWCFDLL